MSIFFIGDLEFGDFSSERIQFHAKINKSKHSLAKLIRLFKEGYFSKEISKIDYMDIVEEEFFHSISWSFNDKTSKEMSHIIFE